MKIFFRLCLTLFFIGIFGIGTAQNIEISGMVIDAETNEPIPFANIALKEIYKGTASNALGEFSFKVDSLPIVLVISHLSYEPFELEVINNEPFNIKLTPGKLLLDELVIKGKGNDEFAYNLVRRAYSKIVGKASSNNYGKAFYRQISKNGDEYSELYEMFYDTKFSNNGVDDWAIQEGRYALKLSTADSFIYNKNFTLMVRLLTIVQPPTEDLIMPVRQDVQEKYNLHTEKIMSVNNRKVAQIRFTKKDDDDSPVMEGDISIDVDSYDVLKLNGTVAHDKLKFISLKGKFGSWKNYKVTCEIAFKQLENDVLALDYMRLGQNFDYYVKDVLVNNVETKSFLTYYEYYTPPKRKKLGGRLLRFRQRDSELLDNIGYNQLFWDENIIVKRTPIEAEVIPSFEEERAFGSIYLNNKNQLILEDYELDNDPYIIHVKQQLNEFELPRKGEKVYIHHDKPFYSVGEKVWFKSYLVNMATNLPSDQSDVLHLDLISPEGALVFSKSYQIENGMAYGQFDIPNNLKAGVFTLNAYTNWMRNYDRKLHYREELEILDAKDFSGLYHRSLEDTVHTFFLHPEGGSLIEGLPVQVGFSAKSKFGDPLNVKGKLVNSEGRTISSIKSEFDGLGSFFMMPKSDVKFQTTITSDDVKLNDFPEVKKAGYSLMVNNLKPNSIDISVYGTLKLEGKKFYILVISNGVLFDRRIGLLTRGLYKAEIPKSNLPNGITQLLLIDEFGDLKCKRMVFLNQPDEVFAKYYLAKKEFKKRERVDLVLELNDENGKSLSNAQISVSVLDKDKVSRNQNARNIRSYFNLGYLVDNKLESPGDLFRDFDRETMKKLDWVMLNQHTVLPEIDSIDDLGESSSSQNEPQRGLSLTGTVIEKKTNTPLANGFVSIISYPDPKSGVWYVTTDEKGIFQLSGFDVIDSISVFIRANNSRGAAVAIEVVFDATEELMESNEFGAVQVEIPNYGKRYIDQLRKSEANVGLVSGRDKIDANASGSRIKTGERPFGTPDHVEMIDDSYLQYADMFQVLSNRFQGIKTEKHEGGAYLKIRGEQGEPLVVLDGLILYDPLENVKDRGAENYALERENLQHILSKINPSIVERVEIIKSKDNSSIYTCMGSNGVIAMFSNLGKNLFLNPQLEEVTELWLQGINSSEAFASPNYSKVEDGDLTPDQRSTIYWNPNVVTNRKGRVKIGFYNSDDARSLQICIEGISKDGVPIFDIFDIGKKSNRNQY